MEDMRRKELQQSSNRLFIIKSFCNNMIAALYSSLCNQSIDESKEKRISLTPVSSTRKVFPLLQLPDDLFYQIADYLNMIDLKRLTNANKLNFSVIKQQITTINLNGDCSMKFCQSEVFRNRVISRLQSKQKQLSFNLTIYHTDSSSNPLHIHHFSSSFQVRLRHSYLSVDLLSQLHHIHSLKLEHCNGITSLPEFVGIRKIHISCFQRLSDINGLRGIGDVTLINCEFVNAITALQSTSILHLEDCRGVSDFSCLGKQKKLTLINCSIRDLTLLSDVMDLHLERCASVMDISPIRNVSNLKLIECPNITTINTLNGTKSLTIGSCFHISNFESLKNLSSMLSLTLLSLGIEDLTPLSRLRHLRLYSCNYISDVSMLGGLDSVHLEECRGIASLRGLETVRKVVLIGLERLSSLEGLRGAIGDAHGNKHVVVSRCLIQDFSPLMHVKVVELLCCPSLENLEQLKHVKSLTLRMCNRVKSLQGLETVQLLKVTQCRELVSVDGVKDVAFVEINDCLNLADINAFILSNAHNRVVLRSCGKITSIRPLLELDDVRIEDCRGIEDEHLIQGRDNIFVSHNCH